MIIVSGRLSDERPEEVPINKALCEGVHHRFRCGCWDIHRHLVESLDVSSKRFLWLLFDGEQANACFLITPPAGEVVEEGRSEVLEACDGSVRQPTEPPLSRSRERGKEDSALHSISVLVERGGIIKLTQMIIRVRCSIILADRRGHVVLGQRISQNGFRKLAVGPLGR